MLVTLAAKPPRRGAMRINRLSLLAMITISLAACADLDERGNEVVGGAVGAAAGAAIGNELGGRDGAVVGAGVGAVTGVVVGQRAGQPVVVQERVIYKEKHHKHKREHDDD